MDARISQYIINSEILQDDFKYASRISQYLVNAEVWEELLDAPSSPMISQFAIMAEVREEKTLNIRYGDIPIEKIYLGNVDIKSM